MDPVIPTGPPRSPCRSHLPRLRLADDLGWTAPVLPSIASPTPPERCCAAASIPSSQAERVRSRWTIREIRARGGRTGRLHRHGVTTSTSGRPSRTVTTSSTTASNNYRLGAISGRSKRRRAIPAIPILWDIWKIVTPDTFLRDQLGPRRGHGRIDCLPIRPAGSRLPPRASTSTRRSFPTGTTAGSKAEGKAGARDAALVRLVSGQAGAVPLLRRSLHLAADGGIPVAAMKLSGKRAPLAPCRAAPGVDLAEASPGYSPLVTVTDAVDHPVIAGTINCPVVGTASP